MRSRSTELKLGAPASHGMNPCDLLIDLGFLQLAAVVGIDYLPFGEDIQTGQTGFAVAIAGAASAAEGELDLGPSRAGVDVNDTGRQVAFGPLNIIDVLRINCRREPVPGLVIHFDGGF